MPISYSPRFQIILRRQANDFQPEDISRDVVSFNTSKAYGTGAGGFQIFTTFNKTLNGKRYDEIIEPDDMIFIKIDSGNGTGMLPVMLGLVDRVAENKSYDGEGRPTHRCRITGMDCGKWLVKHNISWDIAAMESHMGNEATNRMIGAQPSLTLFSGTPADMVKAIVRSLFLKQVPRAVLWVEADDWITTPDDWQTLDLSLLTKTGPVWGALLGAANRPWNTLYCDTDRQKEKFQIGLEKTPFGELSGKLIRDNYFVVTNDHIEQMDLGRSDVERTNYVFYDTPVSSFGDNAHTFMSLAAIKYNEPSVKQHGFHPIYPQTIFSPFGKRKVEYDAEEPDIKTQLEIRTNTIRNWYFNSHEYESGSITTKGRGEIRAGDCVVLPGRKKQYLVQQVDHHFSLGDFPSFKTTLDLIRGQTDARQ